MTLELLSNLENYSDKRKKADSIRVIFSDFHKKTASAQEFVKTISNNENLSYITELKEELNTNQNAVNLLTYSIKHLQIMKSFIGPFCGITDDFDLEISIENKNIKIGDTIRLLTYFNRYDYHHFDDRKLFIEQPTQVKQIQCNNSIIRATNLTSRFGNGYIEFIPSEIGNYSITFSKTIERVNKKTETYESRVEFTVLPK